jgi:hypothetical protein
LVKRSKGGLPVGFLVYRYMFFYRLADGIYTDQTGSFGESAQYSGIDDGIRSRTKPVGYGNG